MATIRMTQLEPDGRSSEVQPAPEQALETENPVNGDNDPPATAVSALERWNYPRHNIARLIATFWSFIVSGANDAAYGVCPSLSRMPGNLADQVGFDPLCMTHFAPGLDAEARRRLTATAGILL